MPDNWADAHGIGSQDFSREKAINRSLHTKHCSCGELATSTLVGVSLSEQVAIMNYIHQPGHIKNFLFPSSLALRG